MMPRLIDLSEKLQETRIEDISSMKWSNRLGVYIKNFYLGTQVYHMKTESGRLVRGPLPTRVRQGGRRALVPSGHLGGLLGFFSFYYFF